MISRASLDDAPGVAALLRACLEDRVITAEGTRYGMEQALPEDRRAYWRAERDRVLVGWAVAGLDVFAPGQSTAFAGLAVHPDRRREGIGSALWEVASAHLEEIGARRIISHSLSDADAIGFAAARRFSREATYTTSALDPRTLAAPPAPPAGIALVPLSAFEDDPEPVFAADHESAQDEPGPSDFSGMTYETWRRMIWDYPDCDHELGRVALAGDAVVGTTFLYADRESGRAANAGTGVVRAVRGQGIGRLLKQHSLAAAAGAGITRVTTQNDDTNAPMLAINARLGYEPYAVGHVWVLER